MGFSRRFDVALALRVAYLTGSLALLIAALATPGLAAARVVAALLTLIAIGSLWSVVQRTNRDLARFVEALRFDDFAQRFAGERGGGFDRLGGALDGAVAALRARRTAAGDEARVLAAALDDAPVALFSIADDGVIALLSKSARRLLDRPVPTRLADIAAYGPELVAALALPPGGRRVTRIVLDGVPQQAILATARVDRLGGGLTIASLLPVGAEFGHVALTAQTDLVRILTHEIMNSLTPVTSLARSSAELVGEAAAREPALADAHAAVTTLAARADGILRFVGSYRDFAFAPDLRRRRFAAAEWATQITALAAADELGGRIGLTTRIAPPHAAVDGDPDLLAQVALNLIRNAALAGATRAELRVTAARGGRTVIEVADDGPGIPPDRREDVFLPFYTTRREGSGVGLSLARQVALAHGGTIAAGDADLGGASIRLAF